MLAMLRRHVWLLSALMQLAGCSGRIDPSTGGNGADGGGNDGVPTGPGSGAGTSASSGGGSSNGTGGGPTVQQVPIVVAQGFVGRTTISCDDGQTWIANRSFDIEGHALVCGDTTPVKCGVTPCQMLATDGTCHTQDECDCGHGTGYSKGVAIGQNQILANFGWGWPGAVLRSQDGAAWDVALDVPMALYPNIVFGAERFVMFTAFQPLLSDDGVTWQSPPPVDPNKGGRASAFLDFAGGRFIAAADGDNIWVSDNRGEAWHMAASIPAGCVNDIGVAQKIITGNGIALMISSTDQTACRSADGGETWTIHPISHLITDEGFLFVQGVFANGKFLAWATIWSEENDMRYESEDGITWTETQTNTPHWSGAVGVTPKGTLVATNGGQYEEQTLSRSVDNGLTWTKLPTSSYVQSHAISRIEGGYVDANTICP